jgi:hypothetical protein
MPTQRASLNPAQAMLRVGATMGLPEVLRSLGRNPREVLSEAGFDPGLFDDPDNVMSFTARGRLLAHCVATTGCLHFGLLVGQYGGLHSLGLVGLLVKYSPDVGTALQNLVRHTHLLFRGAAPTLQVDGGEAILGYQIYQGGAQSNDQVGDGAVAVIFNIMRELCGPDWKPMEAWFAHRKPEDVEPFRRFFRVLLRFDAERACLLLLVVEAPSARGSSRRARNGAKADRRAGSPARRGLSGAGAYRLACGASHRRCQRRARGCAILDASPHAKSTLEHPRGRLPGTLGRDALRHGAADVERLRSPRKRGRGDAPLRRRAFIRAFRRWSDETPARWRATQKALRKTLVVRRGRRKASRATK